MHGFLEVDRIQHLDPVRLIDHLPVLIPHRLPVLVQLGSAPLEHLPALHQDGPLGIRDHIGRVHLHQVRLQPEAGLAGAGTADNQHIFVPGGPGVFGAAVHGQAFRLGQDHVVAEYRVNVGGNVLAGSP